MEIITEKTIKLDLEKDKEWIKHQIDLFYEENRDNLEHKEEVRNQNTSYLLGNSITGETFWHNIDNSELTYIIQPKSSSQIQLGYIRNITFVRLPSKRFELDFCISQTTTQPDTYSKSEIIENDYKRYEIYDNGKHSELYKHLMTKYLIMLEQMKERKNKGE